MALFRFEKKQRQALAGSTGGGAGGGGLDLGEARTLPPSLDLSAGSGESDSLLKGKVLTEGRRSSRSHSVLSPRGSARGERTNETEDEERMRSWRQLEDAAESDFNNSNRRPRRSPRAPPAAVAAPPAAWRPPPARRAAAAPRRRGAADAQEQSRRRGRGGRQGGVAGRRRRQESAQRGGTPLPVAEGEATVQRKASRSRRPPAHRRAGARLRRTSQVENPAEQLRGWDLAAEDGRSVLAGYDRESARRARRRRGRRTARRPSASIATWRRGSGA